MKTYKEYLDTIKAREYEESREEREQAKKWQKENPGQMMVGINGQAGRMSFDYSVEIMGMMMQDFLEEIKELR